MGYLGQHHYVLIKYLFFTVVHFCLPRYCLSQLSCMCSNQLSIRLISFQMFAVVFANEEYQVVAKNWLLPGCDSVHLPPVHMYTAHLEQRANVGPGYAVVACEYVKDVPSPQEGHHFIMSKMRRKRTLPAVLREDGDYVSRLETIISENQAAITLSRAKKQHLSSTPEKTVLRLVDNVHNHAFDDSYLLNNFYLFSVSSIPNVDVPRAPASPILPTIPPFSPFSHDENQNPAPSTSHGSYYDYPVDPQTSYACTCGGQPPVNQCTLAHENVMDLL